MTTNKKCQQCSEKCKQFDFIKIVVCPNFKNNPVWMGENINATPHTGENATLPYKNERTQTSKGISRITVSTHKNHKINVFKMALRGF